MMNESLKGSCVVKSILVMGGLVLFGSVMASSAFAAGCVKGAVVGGVLGHMAGHHGTAGAAAGCVIGHHEANKADRRDEDRSGNDRDRSARNYPQ
jgi:hypothetical protein